VGQTLFKLHSSSAAKAAEALPVLRESFTIQKQPVARTPLILKVLT